MCYLTLIFVRVTDGWVFFAELDSFIHCLYSALADFIRTVGRFGETWLACVFAAQIFAET